MRSMTGYAYKEAANNRWNVSVEIKGYNNRFMELFVGLPSYFSMIEPEVRKLVSTRIQRGKVEVYIRVKELEEKINVNVDYELLDAYLSAFYQIKKKRKLSGKITLDNLITVGGFLKTEKDLSPDEFMDFLTPVLDKAMYDFIETKEREGKATKGDILSQLTHVEDGLANIKTRAAELEAMFKEQLTIRMQELLSGAVDEQRMLAELAVLLTKYSVNEEISRLEAHIKLFKELADSDIPVGKKLDFLCQEMNREINTIGSKSTIVEISQKVVDMKDAVENIREQLRNIE
ncbi:YicC/YloC family endoribonuclease [Spirochaetia bacterium 38H-sp]|uniref:YicC/YloC family endoribonuclease n=1 Tax=Rarispira pelagica TaxID=3141764 RepID=A0ABU9UB16_9SPIR